MKIFAICALLLTLAFGTTVAAKPAVDIPITQQILGCKDWSIDPISNRTTPQILEKLAHD